MPTSSITSLEVSYKTSDRKHLNAVVKFSLPNNSTLRNPDGSTSPSFPAGSNGTGSLANDVTLNFEESSSPSPPGNNVSITRTAIITLNHAFTDAHKTIANLDSSGTVVSSKNETGAHYNEDPDR